MRARNKYGAKKTKSGGYTFDSKGEAARYQELRLLEKYGKISNLKRQIRIPISIDGYDSIKICTYVADFTYDDPEKGFTVEDFKGVETDVFKLKWKLLKALKPGWNFVITKAKR